MISTIIYFLLSKNVSLVLPIAYVALHQLPPGLASTKICQNESTIPCRFIRYIYFFSSASKAHSDRGEDIPAFSAAAVYLNLHQRKGEYSKQMFLLLGLLYGPLWPFSCSNTKEGISLILLTWSMPSRLRTFSLCIKLCIMSSMSYFSVAGYFLVFWGLDVTHTFQGINDLLFLPLKGGLLK